MKKQLIFFGVIFASLFIACSDDKGGSSAGNCPAGYVHTNNQQILNFVRNNNQSFDYGSQYGGNQYSGNQYGSQYGGQSIVQNNCVEQRAYNMAAQQLGIGGGHYGGQQGSNQYCDSYASDVVDQLIAGNPYSDPNDQYYQWQYQIYYEYCISVTGGYSGGGGGW